MTHRSKPAGWRYESFRHSQAAKGISTSGRHWTKAYPDANKYLVKRPAFNRDEQDEQVRERLAEQIAASEKRVEQFQTAQEEAYKNEDFKIAVDFGNRIKRERLLQDTLHRTYARVGTNEYLDLKSNDE